MNGQRNIDFNEENMLFLLLNIIGHDVNHDYSITLGDKRWNEVVSIVRKFKSDFTFTMGGQGQKRSRDSSSEIEYEQPETDPNAMSGFEQDETNPKSFVFRRNVKPKTIQKPESSSFQGIGNILDPNVLAEGRKQLKSRDIYDFVEKNHDFREFLEGIANNILFNYFYYVLTNNNSEESLNNNINNCKLFFIQSQSDIDSIHNDEIQTAYENLYDLISNNFIKYFNDNNKNSTNQKYDYTYYFHLLVKFFDDTTYFKLPIYRFIAGDDKNMPIYGGAEIIQNMSNDELLDIIQKTEQITQKLMEDDDESALYLILKNLDSIKKNNNYAYYAELRSAIINKYKTIFNAKDYPQTYGALDNQLILPFNDKNKNNKLFTSKDPYFFKDEFKYNIDQILKPYKDQLLKNQPKKGRTKNATYGYDVKVKFVEFILKGSLYLTGCCDINGDLNTKNLIINNLFSNNKSNLTSDLKNQINILRSMCCIKEDKDYPELLINDSSSEVEQTDYKLATTSFDNYLMNFVMNKYSKQYQITNDSGQRYFCKNIDKNYIINNAARTEKLGNYLLEREMCSCSSIIDGMMTCSYASAVKYDKMEKGNMDFKLQNKDKNIYYNGKTIINNNIINVKLEIQLPLIKFISNIDADMKAQKSPLIAYNVLSRTLLFIIDFIKSQEQNVLDQIFKQGQIFENLFEIAVGNIQLNTVNFNVLQKENIMDTSVTTNMNIFNVIFNKILQKGIGDVFQEINAVCKYGGYTMDNYSCGENVLSFNTTTGNQLRLFCGADRPSSTRFIFILTNANKEQINTKALGGMATQTRIFFCKLPNQNVCESEPLLIKGGNKKRSLKQYNIRKKRKTNRKNKTNKNKKSKTQKQKKMKYHKRTYKH